MPRPRSKTPEEANLEHPNASPEVIRKLHPRLFPNMSPKMAAIVGCILAQPFAEPSLIGITVTTDRFVLGMRQGEIGFNDFIGAWSDLDRNWRALLDAADLTQTERKEADVLFALALRNGRNL